MVARSARWTAFSWGYWGWGSSIPELVQAFDAVEHSRGFGVPLFVDVRAKQAVRSEGFAGPRSRFEVTLGRARYRWLPDLGNRAIQTGRGPMRLIAPEAVHELLGVVLRAREERRRVVFFCSCESPSSFPNCHRRLVGGHLEKAAAQLRVPLEVEEWPGGHPGTRTVALRVSGDELDALGRGKLAIDLGPKRPSPALLSLPVGSVLRLQAGGLHGFASVCAAVARRGRWELPLYLRPFERRDTARDLLAQATRMRSRQGLN